MGLLLAVACSSFASAVPEVWIVGEGTRELVILDSDTDEIVARVALDGGVPEEARPWGVAFSTLPGSTGAYAFVTQGPYVRVIDAVSRSVVRTIDLATLLGQNLSLRGCAAARPERFSAPVTTSPPDPSDPNLPDLPAQPVDPGPGPEAPTVGVDPEGIDVWKAFLHLSAAALDDSGRSRPWFVVLDQASLLDPASTENLVAGSGPLSDPTPPSSEAPDREPASSCDSSPCPAEPPGSDGYDVFGEAVDVVLVGASGTGLRQRAWYGLRVEPSSPEAPWRIGAVLVVKEPPLASPWRVVETRWIDLPEGTVPPESLGLGAPFDREFPLLPEGPLGSIKDLNDNVSVDVGGTDVVAAAVEGPGPASYVVLTADTAACGEASCTSHLGGPGAVDVAIVGRLNPTRAYVLLRDEDAVTAYSVGIDLLPALETRVPLGSGVPPTGPCVVCPRSMGVRATAIDGCAIYDLTVDKDVAGNALLRWNAEGCEGFSVWCACLGFGDECGCHPPDDGFEPAWTDEEIRLWNEHGSLGSGRPVLVAATCKPTGGTGPHGDSGWRPLGCTNNRSFLHIPEEPPLRIQPAGGGIMFSVTPM